MTIAQQLHKSRFHRPNGAFDPNCPQCLKDEGIDGIIDDLTRCAKQNDQDARASSAMSCDRDAAAAAAVGGAVMRGLTEDERGLLTHVSMWGSDGYPIRKLGRKWVWGPFRSVQGPPVCFTTKREAVASFEAFHQILLDALAGRI